MSECYLGGGAGKAKIYTGANCTLNSGGSISLPTGVTWGMISSLSLHILYLDTMSNTYSSLIAVKSGSNIIQYGTSGYVSSWVTSTWSSDTASGTAMVIADSATVIPFPAYTALLRTFISITPTVIICG